MDNSDNSIRMLNDNISRLFDLFSAASRDMGDEASLKSLNQKIDRLLEQHEKIADAIVALREIVDDRKKMPIKTVISDEIPPVFNPNVFPQGVQAIPREQFSPAPQPNLPSRPQTEPLRPIGMQSSMPLPDRMPPPPMNPLGKAPRRF